MLSRVPYFLISEIPGTYFLISVFLDKRNFGAARCWRSFRVARFAVQSLLPAGGLYVAAAASGGGGGGSDGGGSGISDGMPGRASRAPPGFLTTHLHPRLPEPRDACGTCHCVVLLMGSSAVTRFTPPMYPVLLTCGTGPPVPAELPAALCDIIQSVCLSVCDLRNCLRPYVTSFKVSVCLSVCLLCTLKRRARLLFCIADTY